MAEHRDQKTAGETPGDNAPGSFAKLRAAVGGRLAALRTRTAARLPNWSRRTQIAVSVGLVLLVAHIVVLSVWVPKLLKSETQRRTTLPAALAALDRNSFIEAKRLAKILSDSPLLDAKDRGGPAFVLGAVAVDEADLQNDADRRTTYQQAAKELQESRVRGFPADRQAQGWFLLGKSLCLAGDYSASRTPLEEAIQCDPPFSKDAYAFLAQAYFHEPDVDLAKARERIDRYLAEPLLTSGQRTAALLLDGQILEKLGDFAGCRTALSQIMPISPSYAAALLVEAELLMHEARSIVETVGDDAERRAAAQTKYLQAIEKFSVAQSRGSASPSIALRATFLIGQCRMESGDAAAALTQFDRVRVSSPQSEEATAAALQSADLLRQQGRHDEAISKYRQAVRAIGDPLAYHNEYVSLDAVRKRYLAAYEQYLRNSQFDEAMQLSRLLHPLFPRERELELTGELLRSAAKSYLAKAAAARPEQAKLLSAKARASLRRAGLAFAKLAELHTTSRTYTDDLWNAAECFSGGHDYRQASTSLDLYLQNDLRRRRSSALLMFGEAKLALGETDKALGTLQECIDNYPSDPASYQARVLATKACIEKGDKAKAESLLQANINDNNLTPKSVEWRDSLFAIGSLLENSGRYQEAIQRLEEAVARYPDAPQAVEARYLVAEAYRHLGQQSQQRLDVDNIETLRTAHAKQMQQNLTEAIQRYEHLQSLLAHRAEQNELDPSDKAILRNARFALGASLYDLGRYDEAIRIYASAASLYRNEPEVLDAFVQLAACYRRSNRLADAQIALAQAKAALERINKNADFKLTTNHSRLEWGQLLDQLAAL